MSIKLSRELLDIARRLLDVADQIGEAESKRRSAAQSGVRKRRKPKITTTKRGPGRPKKES